MIKAKHILLSIMLLIVLGVGKVGASNVIEKKATIEAIKDAPSIDFVFVTLDDINAPEAVRSINNAFKPIAHMESINLAEQYRPQELLNHSNWQNKQIKSQLKTSTKHYYAINHISRIRRYSRNKIV